MQDDPGGEPPRISLRKHFLLGWWSALIAGTGIFFYFALTKTVAASSGDGTIPVAWYKIMTPGIWGLTLVLAGVSAFFSASEVGFLSLNKVELRAFSNSDSWLYRLIAHLLKRPGSLLTTILMGNTIVNASLSIVLAGPLAEVFRQSLRLPLAESITLSVILTTATLVFFCEVLPKVFATIRPKTLTVAAVVPLFLIDRLLAPLRYLAVSLVGFIFKVTRLSQVAPAPFLTDDEFITLVSEVEASGILKEEERHMIEGILEFNDVTLDEILVPRPDIVAVREEATAEEAIKTVQEHEYSRMPVYQENLDHIAGILYAKDLLSVIEAGDLKKSVTAYMRRPHFVPVTMSVADFVKTAQRLHIHIAIVVDEFGGTEGLVTLQDALREVVGDIGEEDDEEDLLFNPVEEGVWLIAGNYPLDEFEKQMSISSGDEEHTTIGGFLMALADKILEPGDELEYSGLHFSIQEVNRKRATRLLVRDLRQHGSGEVPAS